MKKKSISELIHFFVRHPLQNSLQMKFWRWLVSPADAEDKEEAIQEEWMNIIAEPDEVTRRSWYEDVYKRQIVYRLYLVAVLPYSQ